MATCNQTNRVPVCLIIMGIIMFALLDLSAASTEKKVPSRIFRGRARPSGERSTAPLTAGLRNGRRFRGYQSSPIESTRRVNYAPLKPVIQNQENKQRASESVHVASLQPINPQGKSQPVFRAAVTKLKIPEDFLLNAKDVNVRVISSQSVLVTWVDPLYEKSAKVGPKRHYTVRYREKGESAQWEYKQIAIRRALVDHLNPDAMYEFSVRISQEDQDGQWSSSVFQRTPESAPTSAPENLFVAPLNGKGTAVTVEWDELSDSSGRIKEYIISYAPALKPFGGKTITYSGKTSSAIIDGLQPGERYIFKIRAANRRGQGPQSKAITVSMPETSNGNKNRYQQPSAHDLQKQDHLKTRKNEVSQSILPSKSTAEPTLDSSEPKKSLSHSVTHIDKKSQLPSSKTHPHSNIETKIYMTTSTPKKLAPALTRRNHPLSNKPFTSVSNAGRSPYKVNPFEKKVSALSVDEDDKTKDPELDGSDIDTSSEKDLPSKKVVDITDESKEEEKINTDYVPSKKVETIKKTKVSHTYIDSTNKKTEKSSHADTITDEYDLARSRPKPSLSPAINRDSSTNHRKPLNRLQGNGRSGYNLARSSSPNQPKYTPWSSKFTEKNEEKDINKKEKSQLSPAAPSQKSSNSDNQYLEQTKTEPKQRSQSNLERAKESSSDSMSQFREINPLNGTIKEKKESQGNNKHSEFPHKRQDLSKTADSLKSFQDRTSRTKQIHSSDKFSDNIQVIDRVNEEKEVQVYSNTNNNNNKTESTKQSLISKYKTLRTTAISALKTAPTSASPSEIKTTSSPSRSNLRESYKYGMFKQVSDATVNKQASVPSLSGQSALSLLEYYRRRSNQVNFNIGSKLTLNGQSRNQLSVTTQTTTVFTTTTTKTLPKENVHLNNNERSIDVTTENEESHPRSPLPKAPSYSETGQHSLTLVKNQKAKYPTTQTEDEKPSSASHTIPNEKTDSFELPVKKEDLTSKYEQIKKAISSRTPIKINKYDSPSIRRIGHTSKQIATDDDSSARHNPQSSAESKNSQLTSATSHSSNADLADSDKEVKEKQTPVLESQKTSHSELSSRSSTVSKVGTALPIGRVKPINSQVIIKDEKHQTNNDPISLFQSSNSYLPNSRNNRFRKPSINKPESHPSTILSTADTHIQHNTEKDRHILPITTILTSEKESSPLSRTQHIQKEKTNLIMPGRTRTQNVTKQFELPSEDRDHHRHISDSLSDPKLSVASDDHIHKGSLKFDQSEKEKYPVLTSKTQLSTHASSSGIKNSNMNGNVYENKRLIDTSIPHEKSSKLEDEEGLHAPPIIKESTDKLPRLSNSNDNSKLSILPRKVTILTTTPTTRSHHQSSTRASPYRLLPSHSRRLHIGRASFSTTARSPTISLIRSTTSPTRTLPPTISSTPYQRLRNSRLQSPLRRQQIRRYQRPGSNGRPNLTRPNGLGNGNGQLSSNNNLNGQRMIYGPQGTKWVVDLNRGLVLNTEGRYLQDSQGKPLRIRLGGDGRTIVDLNGTPVVSPDGLPLFGHGRFSKPVASAQDKPVLTLGGRPLRGLEVARTTRLPTTRITTTITTTTTTATTTIPPTTTQTTSEPTTFVQTTEEPAMPTCAPGTYSQYDEEGNLIMGTDDKPDCYIEADIFSGQETDFLSTTQGPERVTYFDVDQDYELLETIVPTVKTTTKPPAFIEDIDIRLFNSNLVSEVDVAGKKRFTAPYVTYISKDPSAPCSLTEALEHFQVESLEDILPKDIKDEVLPPQKINYNITVVAVEGCHSFVILDWAKPKKGDYITGYLVYSASYDDFLRNKWSTRTAGANNFPVENLKPNTRYYFKVQAKNPYGFGPVSPYVSFVTESDNPLLIVRPPGGEPIWIPFAFRHDTSFTGCQGKQYVKRTWYRKFVGVVLCNSLRYKIYLSDSLKDTFYSIGDSWGRGEDHCQFVDSYMEGRTGPMNEVNIMPTIDGYYRQDVQEPVMFGRIGYGTPHNYVGWYECGVPIPGKW